MSYVSTVKSLQPFPPFFNCVDVDLGPYSENGSGSTKLLNTDPI